MQEHGRLGVRRGAVILLAVLALSATTLAAAGSPARAFRPRATPAHAAALAARHDALVTRVISRHTAAIGAPDARLLARGRLHEPLALTAHGALAVATLAALAAICLVALAVVMGTRREVALRTRAEAKTAQGVATERLAG